MTICRLVRLFVCSKQDYANITGWLDHIKF